MQTSSSVSPKAAVAVKKATGRKKGAPAISASTRAGLLFPIGRVKANIRKRGYTKRVSPAAAVYQAAVLEYLNAEMIELAGKAAFDNKHKRIVPRDIALAIGNDKELTTLLKNVKVCGGGVVPNIHERLIPKKKEPKTTTGGKRHAK